MGLKGAGPGLHEGRGGLYTYICGMNRFLAVMWGNGLNLSQEWIGEVVRG